MSTAIFMSICGVQHEHEPEWCCKPRCGRWRAGDGVSRTIRFRERMDCAILSSCRRVRPFGVQGGEPGELGANSVRRLDGRTEPLAACDQTVLEAGEAVTIVTPTGGGFGAPEDQGRT